MVKFLLMVPSTRSSGGASSSDQFYSPLIRQLRLTLS